MKTREMNALHPTEAQIEAFLAHPKAGKPVFMLNLLKFKDAATYGSGETATGRDAYSRYARAFGEMLRELDIEGVETVFSGNANSVLIGDPAQGDWDAVAIIRYPNAQTMIDTVSSDAYRSIHFHRRAGLEGQMLVGCDGEGVF